MTTELILPTSEYVEIIALVDEEQITRYIGERCKDFDADCYACRAWAMYEENGRIPILFETDELVDWGTR